MSIIKLKYPAYCCYCCTVIPADTEATAHVSGQVLLCSNGVCNDYLNYRQMKRCKVCGRRRWRVNIRETTDGIRICSDKCATVFATAKEEDDCTPVACFNCGRVVTKMMALWKPIVNGLRNVGCRGDADTFPFYVFHEYFCTVLCYKKCKKEQIQLSLKETKEIERTKRM